VYFGGHIISGCVLSCCLLILNSSTAYHMKYVNRCWFVISDQPRGVPWSWRSEIQMQFHKSSSEYRHLGCDEQ